MNRLFPSMTSKPEKIQFFSLIPCCLFMFILIPIYIMPLLGFGLWEEWESSVWLEIGYHVLNGVILLALMAGYLKEDWFMVTTDAGHILKHAALTVGLIVGTELLLIGILLLCGFPPEYLYEWFPVVEMSVSHTPLFAVRLQPVFATLALSVFAPISVCSLFYCLGFAPVCYHKPWLAYPCVAVIALIPSIVDILWRGNAPFVLSGYLVQLPVHLLSCWAYQKTDNVWTPLFTLAATNLLASIVLPILLLR